MTSVDVRAAIDALLKKAAAANDIAVERTQREIARSAFGDIRRLFAKANRLRDIAELDEDAAAMGSRD